VLRILILFNLQLLSEFIVSVCTKIDNFVDVFVVKNSGYFGFRISLGFHLLVDRPMLWYT